MENGSEDIRKTIASVLRPRMAVGMKVVMKYMESYEQFMERYLGGKTHRN